VQDEKNIVLAQRCTTCGRTVACGLR